MKIKGMMVWAAAFGVAACVCAGEVGKSTPGGFTDDFEAAKAEAAKSGKLVLAVFSGSDWCYWCKELEKNYLSKPEFVDEAKKDFVLVFVDNPQDKSVLSKTAKKANSVLTKKYKVRGFPTVKILDAKGGEIAGSRPKSGVSPKGYAEQLRREIKVGPLVKKYIEPYREEMKKTMQEFFAAMMPKMQAATKDKTGEEAEKAQFELGQKMAAEMLAKLKDLRTRVESDQIPDEIKDESEKLLEKIDDTIQGLEKSLKMTWDEVKELKEKAKTAVRESAAPSRERGLVVPLPADAKLETEYFDKVAVPFYAKRIVDAYRPSAGVKPETAERIRSVRRALVRALATGREEFPTHAEFEAAHRLWREKCRDAAVAILHSDGLGGDDRYWQSEKIFNEAVAAFDFNADPFMGYLLRQKAMEAGHYRISRDAKVNRKPIRAAEVACSNAFVRVADEFRTADRRIAERLDELWTLPEGAAELLGNEYLRLCHRAKFCMDRASEERGSGWGSDLTEKQVRGWRNYNDEAFSNLTAAVALRPEDARAAMMLASLNARSCGSDDPVALMNRAVSNSLDRAAESIERVLHFRTSRWGGSTEFLRDAIRAATTNVCTRSTFAYRTAATALGKIFIAETDHVANTNLANAVLTPELSERLYRMFDAYIAAPESAYMPSRDVFVGMGVSLALQKRDWRMVRKYAAQYKKPLDNWQDARWARQACHSSDYNFVINMFEALGRDAKRRELFVDAEIAISEGRFADADAAYRKLQSMKGLSQAEQIIVARQGFRVRKTLQERKGGWVDVMPTPSAYEAVSWWGVVGLKKDGRARVGGGGKSYYRLELPLPGKGAEYEATVHFETNDVKQTKWAIGWGLARPYTGFGAKNSSWAFPFIGFWRDGTGDHVDVECPTEENSHAPKLGKMWPGNDEGFERRWSVYQASLEKRDDHTLGLRWDEERLTVSVDGKEVWSVPTQTAMDVYEFRDRIQSDFSVLPVWKVHKNTAFSAYRYRLIGKGQ